MKEPFLAAVPVLQKLEDAGFEAYFVGGSVRDLLLDKGIHDVDIATAATPEEVKRVFSKTVDVGIEHGTVLVLFQNESYEITTFRTEAEYQDNRRPKEVTFIRNLTEDLQRRDFTMNAIAMDKKGQLIDPFHGQKAIKDQIIQTVGHGYERFQEDALRMMRAVRFVSQLSFQIEKETLASLMNHVHLLENIAVERKHAEFEKLLLGKNWKKALRLIIETNIYSYLPGLINQKESLKKLLEFDWNHLSSREMWTLLVFCLQLEEKSIEEFLRNWRLPLNEIRAIQKVFYYLNKRLNSSWSLYDLYSATKEIFITAEKIYLVIKGMNDQSSINYYLGIYEKLPIKDRSEIDLTGNDLMEWYSQSGGPWVKDNLLMVEQAIIEGIVSNEKQVIKEWLMECNHK
jgi:tRNA nucleotidyltransferase (CCA-adding enzyme)